MLKFKEYVGNLRPSPYLKIGNGSCNMKGEKFVLFSGCEKAVISFGQKNCSR